MQVLGFVFISTVFACEEVGIFLAIEYYAAIIYEEFIPFLIEKL